jgi:hypothetical protein
VCSALIEFFESERTEFLPDLAPEKSPAREQLPVSVAAVDHLVLTVRDVRVTCDFYVRVLGMREVVVDAGRKALALGNQKINLQQAGAELDSRAAVPMPGSADRCFVTGADLDAITGQVPPSISPFEPSPLIDSVVEP